MAQPPSKPHQNKPSPPISFTNIVRLAKQSGFVRGLQRIHGNPNLQNDVHSTNCGPKKLPERWPGWPSSCRPGRRVPFQLVRQCAAHGVAGDDDAGPGGAVGVLVVMMGGSGWILIIGCAEVLLLDFYVRYLIAASRITAHYRFRIVQNGSLVGCCFNPSEKYEGQVGRWNFQ